MGGKALVERRFGPVWFIPGQNKGKYPHCHSIYLEGPGILIDPASDRERLKQLRESPGVREVWLSHWHEDHIKDLDLFDDLPFRVAERDAPPLADLDVFIESYGEMNEQERVYWRKFLSEEFHFRPRRPAAFLRGGETLTLGGVTVDVIAAPGHTPGHTAFLFREEGVLFLADYDLTPFGPWYGDVESSIEDTMRSVQRLKEIHARIWLTGHEQGVFEEEPGVLWDHYVGVIYSREARLLDFLARPRTFQEITGAWILYGKPREPKDFFELGERLHMKKHLEKLMAEGRVSFDGERYHRESA